MSYKKKRKSIIDRFFEGSFFDGSDKFFDEFKQGMSGGYYLSVTQTPEGTKVYAKVSGNTDVNELRRKLQQTVSRCSHRNRRWETADQGNIYKICE